MESQSDGAAKASTSSLIKDGAVSGVLPAAEAFAVHYPGYPSSPSRAVETLGGLSEIAKLRSSESGFMELRFRPEDPYSHPAYGVLRPAASLLLRITKTKDESCKEGEASSGKEQLSADVVARVNQAYHFEGMVDYQHVLGVQAAEARRKKRPWGSDDSSQLEQSESLDMDNSDVMMLVPPLFSIKDKPEKIVLKPSVNLFSKNIQRAVVEHRWEMDIDQCLAIAFNIKSVPKKINWEDNISKGTTEWEWQVAVSKLFEERSIWPRWSLHERMLDDGMQVSENQLKRLLFRSGYYFSTGPFGRFWIRKGYDPRTDPESRIFQKVDFRVPPELRNLGDMSGNSQSKQRLKDICRFQVIPSKTFVCLQLFELVDDFIQEEIRKPSSQTTCSHATGWFSRPMLRTLRLHVSIRFLSLYSNEAAEDYLRSARGLLERSKKEEACSSKFQRQEKKDEHVNGDSNCSNELPCSESNELEEPHGPNDCEIEEEEEEEEEVDGYEFDAMAQEGGNFPVDGNSYNLQESIPNDYLQELLRCFPFNKDAKDTQQNDLGYGSDFSDEKYEIYEQESDNNEDYYNGEDDFS
ncbi:uncharacterized protein [Typha angustifolia]|uniref:uncharacterized protein n=1 Tax=Typha angustifolia TaxID=59011 RepID=UPI003C2CFFA1